MSEVTSYAREVRDGAVDDPTFYGCIYAAPEDADPFDEATWHACNPALGDFRSLDEFRAEAQRVRRLPAREPSFRLLYLNQAVDTTSRFLNARDWKACMGRVDARDLEGRACYLGLDLASTTDLTACAAWFPETGDALAWFWAPAEGVEERERRDGVPYQQWVREGWLELTPGRALDRHVVARRLAEIVDRFDVRGCAYDRWRAADLRQMLADEDVRLHLVDWGQGFKDMSPALDALETAVLNRELRHGGNPCLTFNVASAVAESDPAGGRKLAKNKSPARIDGAVALAMALGLASTSRKKRRSVYARRGVQTLEIGAS
jgi:phage terminase large subunit-like protein